MKPAAIVPLIDLVFLTLGSILGIMTEMEKVTAIPVQVTRVGHGAPVVKQGRFAVLSLTGSGLALDGEPVALEELGSRLAGREVVLRAQEDLPTSTTVQTVMHLVELGVDVSLEVKEQSSQQHNAGRR